MASEVCHPEPGGDNDWWCATRGIRFSVWPASPVCPGCTEYPGKKALMRDLEAIRASQKGPTDHGE